MSDPTWTRKFFRDQADYKAFWRLSFSKSLCYYYYYEMGSRQQFGKVFCEGDSSSCQHPKILIYSLNKSQTSVKVIGI